MKHAIPTILVPVLAVAAFQASGAGPEDVHEELVVHRLTVLGKDGKTVARLEETPNGPALALFDGEHLKTTVSDDGLVLYDGGGTPRLTVQDLGEGGSGIALLDAAGRIKLTLRAGNGGLGFGGESAILFHDEKGKMRGQVRFEESAGMMIGLHDRTETLRAGLRLDSNENGRLMFLDEQGGETRGELHLGFDPEQRRPTIEAYQNERLVWGQ